MCRLYVARTRFYFEFRRVSAGRRLIARSGQGGQASERSASRAARARRARRRARASFLEELTQLRFRDALTVEDRPQTRLQRSIERLAL